MQSTWHPNSPLPLSPLLKRRVVQPKRGRGGEIASIGISSINLNPVASVS